MSRGPLVSWSEFAIIVVNLSLLLHKSIKVFALLLRIINGTDLLVCLGKCHIRLEPKVIRTLINYRGLALPDLFKMPFIADFSLQFLKRVAAIEKVLVGRLSGQLFIRSDRIFGQRYVSVAHREL